jgi:hypothetical protein
LAELANVAAVVSQWKIAPEIVACIEKLMEAETAGDPLTGLKRHQDKRRRIPQNTISV